MTLTEILEELSGRSFETSDYATSDKSEKNINRKWDRRIAQAKKAIEEMFGEWVPSEKKDDYRGEFMIDTVERLFAFHRGWNACCEEIRNRVKEGR